MRCTYLLDVEYVEADEMFTTAPKRTRVRVDAETDNEAELIALEMVAAQGRKPVRVAIDWDNF